MKINDNMEQVKRIIDLPEGASLEGVKVKTPCGKVGFWKSNWNAGVWLSNGKDSRRYPIFVNKISDALSWEITEEEVNV
jgi:hypothetical protein